MDVEKAKAIELALQDIQSRNPTAFTFKRGYNDCWALAQRYDYHLRGAETPFSSLKLEFVDLRTWKKSLASHGIRTLEELADFANYELTTKPAKLGDLGFQRPMAVLLATPTHWWSISEKTYKLQRTARNPLLNGGELVFKPRG